MRVWDAVGEGNTKGACCPLPLSQSCTQNQSCSRSTTSLTQAHFFAGEYSIIAGRINDLAWDGDSQRIIAVGNGKELFGHCITADSGNSVGEISGHSSQINCVSIRQQRPLRAATGSDDTNVVFFHGAPFKYNASLQGNHNKFVFGTAFSPDGATLVSVGADRRVWLYDGKTGETKNKIGDGEHTGRSPDISSVDDG